MHGGSWTGLRADLNLPDTCREKECYEFVDSLSIFCKDRSFPLSNPLLKEWIQLTYLDGCSKQNCLQLVLAEGLCIHRMSSCHNLLRSC